MIKVVIQEHDFDAGLLAQELVKLGGGAISTFTGLVRDDGGLGALELEHYPAMTEKALIEIANVADEKWALHGITIVHRVGKLNVGEQIVSVGTCSDHRHAAIAACSYIMDRLKTDAPFWKKEICTDGSENWVEERQSDLDAKENWKNS